MRSYNDPIQRKRIKLNTFNTVAIQILNNVRDGFIMLILRLINLRQ